MGVTANGPWGSLCGDSRTSVNILKTTVFIVYFKCGIVSNENYSFKKLLKKEAWVTFGWKPGRYFELLSLKRAEDQAGWNFSVGFLVVQPCCDVTLWARLVLLDCGRLWFYRTYKWQCTYVRLSKTESVSDDKSRSFHGSERQRTHTIPTAILQNPPLTHWKSTKI